MQTIADMLCLLADLSSMHMSSHRILGDFLVPMILPLPRDSLKGGLLADKTLWQAGLGSATALTVVLH